MYPARPLHVRRGQTGCRQVVWPSATETQTIKLRWAFFGSRELAGAGSRRRGGSSANPLASAGVYRLYIFITVVDRSCQTWGMASLPHLHPSSGLSAGMSSACLLQPSPWNKMRREDGIGRVNRVWLPRFGDKLDRGWGILT